MSGNGGTAIYVRVGSPTRGKDGRGKPAHLGRLRNVAGALVRTPVGLLGAVAWAGGAAARRRSGNRHARVEVGR